jgi:hypothetical protein
MTNTERKSLKILSIIGAISLLIAIMAILSSCNPQSNSDNNHKEDVANKLVLDSTSNNYQRVFRIYELDGCEYVVVGYGNMQWGSHKGDCKNPIHRNTEEKHFDCTVESIAEGDSENRYMYTTECGCPFYSNEKMSIGDVVKGFKSPKHK